MTNYNSVFIIVYIFRFYDPDTTETQRFVSIFDRFFDSLHVRSPTEWIRKRKPGLKPYTSERLKVNGSKLFLPSILRLFFTHMHVFIMHPSCSKVIFDVPSASSVYGLATSEKNKMLLSKETLEGIQITGIDLHTHMYARTDLIFAPCLHVLCSELFCGNNEVSPESESIFIPAK